MAIQSQDALTIAGRICYEIPRIPATAQEVAPYRVAPIWHGLDSSLYVDRCVGAQVGCGQSLHRLLAGHGAMLLKHAHPAVVEAVLRSGTRYARVGVHDSKSTVIRMIMDLVVQSRSNYQFRH